MFDHPGDFWHWRHRRKSNKVISKPQEMFANFSRPAGLGKVAATGTGTVQRE
jgi:hypothetical protein